jgi:hypothetical protein
MKFSFRFVYWSWLFIESITVSLIVILSYPRLLVIFILTSKIGGSLVSPNEENYIITYFEILGDWYYNVAYSKTLSIY